MKKCADCGKECKPTAIRCVLCSNLKLNERARESRAAKSKHEHKLCESCQNYYLATTPSQLYCSFACKEKVKTALSNASWSKKKKRKPSHYFGLICEPRPKECEI